MISKLKLTQKNYVRKSITSFTPGPVQMSVTGTPNFSSMFFMNDVEFESN